MLESQGITPHTFIILLLGRGDKSFIFQPLYLQWNISR